MVRYNVEKDDTDTIADLGSRFKSITAGGTGDNSKDNWISFYAPAETTVCAMALEAPSNLYCANYSQVPNGPHRPDYSTIAKGVDAKSGKRYVLLASAPAMLFFSVDEAGKKLNFEYRGGEGTNSKGNNDGICDPGEPCLSTPHADTFEFNGEQYLITAVESFEPCGYYLVTYKLNVHDKPGLRAELGGGMKVIMQLFRCGGSDAWVDEHYGCAKSAPYCAVSTTYGGFRAQRADNDTTPIKRSAHLSEIFVVGKNGADVLRLMQNRSVPLKSEPDFSYWTAPRACMSPDGGYVVADSNFGEANKHRVLVIPTGLGPAKVAEGGVVDAASYQAKLARGSLFTVFGENLSGCVQFSASFPLPSDICGTSVFFNGAASSLLHASPGQVTGIVPEAGGGSPLVEVQRISSEGAVKAEAQMGAALAETAPSLFEYALTDGTRHAVAQAADYSLVGPETAYSRPLKRGEVGILYANGLGPADRPLLDFEPAPLQPLARTANPVEVIVNDVSQKVLFSGLVPELSRIFQVNFELKTDTPVQPVNEVYVRVLGSESPRSRLAIAP
ncbi:MAG: hypothetical protein IT514_16075 [Burkholderiales bacterium]|nr:hypothetical protein [Burkholderiales bacterium]